MQLVFAQFEDANKKLEWNGLRHVFHDQMDEKLGQQPIVTILSSANNSLGKVAC